MNRILRGPKYLFVCYLFEYCRVCDLVGPVLALLLVPTLGLQHVNNLPIRTYLSVADIRWKSSENVIIVCFCLGA